MVRYLATNGGGARHASSTNTLSPWGMGLAHLPASLLADDIAAAHLETGLDAWLPPCDGWYPYYPGRFQVPPRLRVFIDFTHERLGAPSA